MRMTKLIAATIASTLVATPVLANPASSLSVAKVRAASSAEGENKAVAGGAIIGVLAAAAVIGGIVIAADEGGDGDDSDSN
ncbi:hypothetical protein [Sphingomonas sp.]|uniref:hypothetical protein n=1 Tax=Sphingomonas sp. TaxID=28214 RepID=UPI002B8D7CDC|nr:hypothetical protein [Sphingomonas sp.]HTG37823.1 hypothetical protein [Sphingomonas sp.]